MRFNIAVVTVSIVCIRDVASWVMTSSVDGVSRLISGTGGKDGAVIVRREAVTGAFSRSLTACSRIC